MNDIVNLHPEKPALDNPDLYINRELSLLEFNRRVLEQARDPGTPLLERLRFLCIANSNLDEFFEIRVAGLMQQIEFGATQGGPDKMSPADTMHRISGVAHELVSEQYEILNNEMFPALEREGIAFARRKEWSQAESEWVKKYFQENLLPILSPHSAGSGAPVSESHQQEPSFHRRIGR